MDKKKLTRANMSWGHWSPRKRYIKDDSGAVVETVYDRLFIGLRPAGRAYLESRYTGDEPVMVFMLGVNNVVLTHRRGDSVVYVNRLAGAQAREYVAFYIDRLQAEAGITAEVVEVDDMPTAVHTRNGGGGVDSLDKAIAMACGRDIDNLGI